MNNDLFKILKELKEIKPSADYSKKSKKLLLLEIKAGKRYGFKFGDILTSFYSRKFILSTVSAIVLLLIISGGIYYIKNQANESDLIVKASEVNASIQVKLNEIQYLIKNPNNNFDAGKIIVIQSLLQRAADDLRAAVSSNSQDLNQSLEKIKAVQEILNQIDASPINK